MNVMFQEIAKPIAAEVSHLGAPTQNTLKIIVLDDECFDRLRLQRLISQADASYEVTCCGTLAEFEFVVMQERFDLAFIDRKLGAQDGLDAFQVLRKSSLNSALPVIMIAGDAPVAQVVEAIQRGCHDFLSKDGLCSNRLASAIRKVLAETLPPQRRVTEGTVLRASEQVVEKVSEVCSERMKPSLRRIYSQIGRIRCGDQEIVQQFETELDVIEAECMTLWQFIDELGEFGGSFVRRNLDS